MTLWPRFIRRRWEQREREAEAAEERLADARAEHAEVRRLTAETRRIREANGFTEGVFQAMGMQR